MISSWFFFSPRQAVCAASALIAALVLMPHRARAAFAEPYERAIAVPVSRLPPCHSRAGCDRRDHDYSGTRGRMGLGADPAHPEGPGNAPN